MKKFCLGFPVFLSLLLTSFLFTGCNNDDDAVTNEDGLVLAYLCDIAEQEGYGSGMDEETKAAHKTAWGNGDAIGVFCVEPGKNLGTTNYASNKKYVYDLSTGKFKPATESDKIWISREGSFRFYAYWPYDAAKTEVNGQAMELSVSDSQENESNHRLSDFIGGRSVDVVGETGVVNMEFQHLMSAVRFQWTRSSSDANEYVRALFGRTAVVNLQTLTSVQKSGEAVGTGLRMNVKNAYNASNGSTEFQAYVPPVTISNSSDIFVPYDKNGNKIAAVKANLAGSTKKLEAGYTYDLAGTMFTVEADVRRNGDIDPSLCALPDGCVISQTGGGASAAEGGSDATAGKLKMFTGRFLSGRTCTVSSKIAADKATDGTFFLGWYKKTGATTWTKVSETETYTFEVTDNIRLQARYEKYVFGPWKISWSQATTTDGNGNFTTTLPASGATGFEMKPTATRTVTLDGNPVNDTEYTTRTSDQIEMKMSVATPNYNQDMFGQTVWSWDDASKKVTVNANTDLKNDVAQARKTTYTLRIKDEPAALSGNGANLTVVQSASTIVKADWKIVATPTGHTGMTANGSSTASVDLYVTREWSMSGVIVKVEEQDSYEKITGTTATADAAHWTLTPGAAISKGYGTNNFFTLSKGRRFTMKAANNKSLNARSNTVTFKGTAANVSTTVKFEQLAGVKTNISYTDWSITGSASPIILTTMPSEGTNNTSVITVSATRDMNYTWNNVATDKGKDVQSGNPTIAITTGGNFASLNGTGSGSRVSVQKNYDASSIGTAVPDRTIVVTATIANSENGSAASKHNITITQKGGTVTEERSTATGQSISTKGAIGADGGSVGYNITNPTRSVTVKLDGTTVLSTYTETGVLTAVSSNSGTFTANTSSVSAGSNLGSTEYEYTNWSAGSVTISGGTVDVSGGSRNVSISVPTRTRSTRYNTSNRSATLTGTWTITNTTDGSTSTLTSTCTATQNGSTATISGSSVTESYSIKSVTASGAATYSGGTSSSGTVSFGDNHGTPVSKGGSWSGGSVSLSKTSFGRTGGSATISYTSPTRSTWEEYNSSSRSTTVTATFSYSGASDKTATSSVSQSGSTSEVPNSRTTETAGAPSLSESSSWSNISGTTLSVNESTSTSTSYSMSGGSISISGSPIASGGGTATASTSAPSCSWTEYYDAVNRSGSVTASWAEGSISKSASYSQSASSSTKNSGTGSASGGTVSWPSWCPGGTAGSNTGAARSGEVSVTWNYNGESVTKTATVSQGGATITYRYELTSASGGSLTWDYRDTSAKTVTATGTVTIYKSVNGGAETNDGTLTGCTFTFTLSSVSGSHFSSSGNRIYPTGANTTSSNHTGTATGTVTASKSGYTITGSKSVTVNLTHTYKEFTVSPG